jgi:hypothetical protein
LKTAIVKTADASNVDVSLNDLSANTTFDLSVNLIGSIDDLSNAKIVATATTRPSDFSGNYVTGNDISQNLVDTSANTIVLKIKHKDLSGTLDISGYFVVYSGNNGTNASSGTITKTAVDNTPDGSNNDVSLNDLSANTTYDLSVCLFNVVDDLSNTKVVVKATTRPSNYASADVSQNLTDTSANTIVMKIHNSQISGTLDISGYEIDISGTSWPNAQNKTILKTAVVKTADASNVDVSLNDLSANTTFDLSVNLIGSVDDLSNAKIVATATTRPSDFSGNYVTGNDISQNLVDTSANTIVLKIKHKDVTGTLDISGYFVDYSGNNGANASSGTITKTAVDNTPDGSNNDVSLNDLSANTTYDLSVCLFNVVNDLSNAKVVVKATTRPSNYASADVSQNLSDTSANTIVMKIHNSQIQGTLDISGYEVDYSGNNGTNASSGTIIKTAVV